jgi:hypothetical protein
MIESVAPIVCFLLAAAFSFVGDGLVGKVRTAALAGGRRSARRMGLQMAFGAGAVLIAAVVSAFL